VRPYRETASGQSGTAQRRLRVGKGKGRSLYLMRNPRWVPHLLRQGWALHPVLRCGLLLEGGKGISIRSLSGSLARSSGEGEVEGHLCGAIVGCAAHLFCVLADRDEVAGESKVTIGRRNRCSWIGLSLGETQVTLSQT